MMNELKNNPKDELLTNIVDKYCKVWNETDPGLRAIELNKVWSEGGVYTDPTVLLKGADALLSHITKVQSRRPGAKVECTSVIDVHHNIGRFAWQIVQQDGTRLPESLDVVFFSEDGRKIKKIIGFFGKLKPV